MIQVYIDSSIEQKASSYAKEMLSYNKIKNLWDFYNEMNTAIDLKKATDAEKIKEENIISHCREYTKEVISHYKELLVIRHEDFKYYTKYFESIFITQYDSKKFLSHKIKYGSGADSNKSFYEHLVKCMGYPTARNCMLKYIKQSGIKVCPYCNISYAETYQDDNKWLGRYHLDHYLDKHKHPLLGVSFFNLIPSCSSCNGHKSDDPLSFYLYSNRPSKSPFHFSFSGIADYLINGVERKMYISFEQKNEFQKNFNSVFDIERIYNEHIDELEEILNRYLHEFGDDRTVLKESFLKLPFDDSKKTENVLGKYLNDSDIHKKSFVKMKLDLGRYLKII